MHHTPLTWYDQEDQR